MEVKPAVRGRLEQRVNGEELKEILDLILGFFEYDKCS